MTPPSSSSSSSSSNNGNSTNELLLGMLMNINQQQQQQAARNTSSLSHNTPFLIQTSVNGNVMNNNNFMPQQESLVSHAFTPSTIFNNSQQLLANSPASNNFSMLNLQNNPNQQQLQPNMPNLMTNIGQNNIDLNQLLQQNNVNYNGSSPQSDTTPQLLLSDAHNFMNNQNTSSAMQGLNPHHQELLHQIISTTMHHQPPGDSTPQISQQKPQQQKQSPPQPSSQQQDAPQKEASIATKRSAKKAASNATDTPEEHVPHLGSVELNQDPTQMYFPIACVNCRGRHKKCEKNYPSCAQCIKRGVECSYRSPKKKGRHNQSSSSKQEQVTTVQTTSGSSSSRFTPYPTSTNASTNNNLRNIELSEELSKYLSSQLGPNFTQQYSNVSELLSNIQLSMMNNKVNEQLVISAQRKKTIDLYEGVISLGYSLVDINVIEQALFETDNLESFNYSPEFLSLLYAIHAVTCQALGQDQQAFLSFQKTKNCLANCFDSWNNVLVANTYSHLALYCASSGDTETARFYLNFVDFYFGNRHKIDFDRLDEYVIDASETNSLREFLLKNADNPNVKQAMSNLGINSAEFLKNTLREDQTKVVATRHIFEKMPKEADFKLLKFRILCGVTIDACGKDQYPVMIKADPPAYLQKQTSQYTVESGNDLSILGSVSPEGTFHLSTNTQNKGQAESSNFKGYTFSSYFCRILADINLYITGRIPKHVLYMLTQMSPSLENMNEYMQIIDSVGKVYREHEKRRAFNEVQLPLALCIFNLFLFGDKLFLLKEVYRKTNGGLILSRNIANTHIPENKSVLDFLHSEILKLAQVVTKCTTIENFDLLKPNLWNCVAAGAEVVLEVLESLSECSHMPFSAMIDALELNHYFSTTYPAHDLQNPVSQKQILDQFEQQLLEMLDHNIKALNTWTMRYHNDKYAYLIERMQQFKQMKSNQAFQNIHNLHLPQFLDGSNINKTYDNNYPPIAVPSELQSNTNLQNADLFKLATYLFGEIGRNNASQQH